MTDSVFVRFPQFTPQQFNWVAEELNLRPQERERLYQAVVEGRPVTDVATEAECTVQAVYSLVRKMVRVTEDKLKSTNKTAVLLYVNNSAVKDIRKQESLELSLS